MMHIVPGILMSLIGAVCFIISLAMFGHGIKSFLRAQIDNHNPYWHSSVGFYISASGIWMLCFLGSIMVLRSL